MALTAIVFVALLSRPSTTPKSWRGIRDPYFLSAVLVGVAILCIVGTLLYALGAPVFLWWILVVFALLALVPVVVTLVTPNSQNTLQALMQKISLLNGRQEFIWKTVLVLLPLVSLSAAARLGVMMTTTTPEEGAVTGASLMILILSVMILFRIGTFSSESIVVYAGCQRSSTDHSWSLSGAPGPASDNTSSKPDRHDHHHSTSSDDHEDYDYDQHDYNYENYSGAAGYGVPSLGYIPLGGNRTTTTTTRTPDRDASMSSSTYYENGILMSEDRTAKPRRVVRILRNRDIPRKALTYGDTTTTTSATSFERQRRRR